MKNKFIIPMLIIAFGFSAFIADESISTENVWQKYLNTFGKSELVKAVKTFSSINIVETPKGKITTKIKIKAPDKVFMEVFYPSGAKFTYILNGKEGRMKSQMGTQDIPDNYLKSLQNMALIFPEIHYTDVKFENMEKMEGKEYYNFKVHSNGLELYYLIDKQTYTTFRVVSDDSYMQVLETVVIDGIRVIKKSRSIMYGQELIADYSNFEINPELPDSLFELF